MAYDGRIPLGIRIDARPIPTETVYAQAGAYVLCIATTILRAEVPLELHSTYVGHPGCPTETTHLQLGPAPSEPNVSVATHAEHDICVVFTPRNAVYDHAHELVRRLQALGLAAAIDVPEGAFTTLETGAAAPGAIVS